MRPEAHQPADYQFLTPREAARIFGVRTVTLAQWAREGKIACRVTPGGHRRYPREAIQELLDSDQGQDLVRRQVQQWELDAVRMYNEGWSIRQVAARFECGYSRMRRILVRNTTLRP
jgi:excisionase family DNA binding protein